MGLYRMMTQMQKNAQVFEAIFGVSEKRITETQNVWKIWWERERVNDERSQERVSISVEKIRKQCRKIPNWKAPGRNSVQGYWIKNLSSLHQQVSSQMNRILMGEDDLSEWMTHDRTVLCQKDPQKGNTADNYRPITWLPLMWRLLTGKIVEEMYNYFEREKILPEEQKWRQRVRPGTKDQLLIDKTVSKVCKKILWPCST